MILDYDAIDATARLVVDTATANRAQAPDAFLVRGQVANQAGRLCYRIVPALTRQLRGREDEVKRLRGTLELIANLDRREIDAAALLATDALKGGAA